MTAVSLNTEMCFLNEGRRKELITGNEGFWELVILLLGH